MPVQIGILRQRGVVHALPSLQPQRDAIVCVQQHGQRGVPVQGGDVRRRIDLHSVQDVRGKCHAERVELCGRAIDGHCGVHMQCGVLRGRGDVHPVQVLLDQRVHGGRLPRRDAWRHQDVRLQCNILRRRVHVHPVQDVPPERVHHRDLQ